MIGRHKRKTPGLSRCRTCRRADRHSYTKPPCSACGQKVTVRPGRPTETAMCRACRATKRIKTCLGCNIEFDAPIKNASVQKYCSYECAMKSRIKPKPEKVRKPRPTQVVTLVQCGWCHALHGSKRNKYCSQNCQFEANRLASKSRRSALRAALEDRDFSVLVFELEKRSTITETGCWLWPTLNRKGYPITSCSRRLHRAVIECKYGASLGSQQAHHKCANTACVNPNHLQPVTHRENIAEMMERQSLLSRIEELEQRLSQVAPNDPLLMVIPCGTAD